MLRPRYFVFGVNLPWLDGGYGHDLGPNHVLTTRARCTYNSSHLQAYFTHMSQNGIRVVRFWTFEGLEGLKFDSKGRVIAIDQDMKDNVQDVMRNAASEDLKLYWCILAGTWEKDPTKHHYSALKGLIQDPSKRSSFITNGLKGFLDLVKPYRNHVFAIDLINEPEGLAGKWRRILTKVTWKQVTEYIELAATACRDEGFDCSVGFQEPETIGMLQKSYKSSIEKLDFYDFHVYNDPGTIIKKDKKYREQTIIKKDKPCIIGEFGQDGDTNNDRLRDDVQLQADGQLMKNAWKLGYHGCVVWYYNWFGYNPTLKKGKKLDVKHSLLYAKPTALERSTFGQDFDRLTPVEKVSKLKEIERPVWDEIRRFVQKNQPVLPPCARAWHVPS